MPLPDLVQNVVGNFRCCWGNYPYASSFLAPLPAWPMAAACNKVLDAVRPIDGAAPGVCRHMAFKHGKECKRSQRDSCYVKGTDTFWPCSVMGTLFARIWSSFCATRCLAGLAEAVAMLYKQPKQTCFDMCFGICRCSLVSKSTNSDTNVFFSVSASAKVWCVPWKLSYWHVWHHPVVFPSCFCFWGTKFLLNALIKPAVALASHPERGIIRCVAWHLQKRFWHPGSFIRDLLLAKVGSGECHRFKNPTPW